MKKIILSILIVLLFFTMGVSIAQEKELAEKAKLKRMGKELELIMKQEENHKKLLYLYEEIKKIKKKLKTLIGNSKRTMLMTNLRKSRLKLIKDMNLKQNSRGLRQHWRNG